MATFTSRHGLRQPAYTDVEDVDLDVNFNMQRVDDRINYATCTSSTRPTGVPEGQLIRETDTGNILILISGTWVQLANNNYSKGKIALTTSTADGATVGNGDFLHLSTTFAAEAGRKYLVEIKTFIESVTNANSGMQLTGSLRWATGGTVTIAGNLIGGTFPCNIYYGTPGQSDISKFAEFFPNTTGNVTVGLFLSKSSGTQTWKRAGAANKRNFLLVRDWGTI